MQKGLVFDNCLSIENINILYTTRMILYLALRNLLLQRKRYTLIGIAVMIGFALITLIAGASTGALEAVRLKAGRYFSGNASITGYIWGVAGISDSEKLVSNLKKSTLPIRTLAERTSYNRNDATIFYNGETIRQRKLIGIDFIAEGAEFSGLSFNQGSWKALASDLGKDCILISISAARILGCRVGDDVTLYLTTDTGQYNTARLIVKGIFNETSLFGYVAYMRRADLNGLLLRAPLASTDVAVYAKDGVELERFAEDVRLELSKYYKVFPRFNSREERDTELAKGTNTEETLAVLSQNAQLAQIKQLLDALLAITYFTLALFIAIVMVGILNTYRVLVHERTREIGAMRAVGMQRSQVHALFLAEAALLALLSSALGLLVGLVALRILSLVDLSSLPAAGMFLEAGHLRFQFDNRLGLVNGGLMIGAAVLAAWDPANRAANINPADAMRSI